jgi:hypothetical protein
LPEVWPRTGRTAEMKRIAAVAQANRLLQAAGNFMSDWLLNKHRR